jgi:NADPH-dependent curcumin reductase CurA
MRERFNAAAGDLTVLTPDPEVPLGAYLNVLGGVGLVAYGGLFRTGALKTGEQVFVSAAAGAVGSIAAQLAKVHGCHVVGSAGTDEKVRWLREGLKLDAAINYRTQDLEAALTAATPKGLDVYFDNVGGAHLDAALARMNDFGRVAVCGMISTYNGAPAEPIRNLKRLMYGRIRMEGFVFRDLHPLEPAFLGEVTPLVKAGQIVWKETMWNGFERIPEALLGLLAGRNIGKALVQVEP